MNSFHLNPHSQVNFWHKVVTGLRSREVTAECMTEPSHTSNLHLCQSYSPGVKLSAFIASIDNSQ